MSIPVSLLLCMLFMTAGLGSSCIDKERQALLDVQASIIDFYEFEDNWGSKEEKSSDCCKWWGVTCNNQTGHVISLDISNAGTGKLSPSLQVLNQLSYLDMSRIDFQSNPLPGFLGSLSKLEHLLISSANLSGSIPHQLANLSNLQHLDLSVNSLSGSIPHQLANLSNLQYLYLSNNSLSGSIPHQLANLSNLQDLDLSYNSLSGSIPHQLANLSNLKYLHLENNSLSGSIPFFFGDLASLIRLHLSNNGLSGNVPNSLGRLSNLDWLDLSDNSLNGSIPNFIGSPLLRYLDMSSNQLHGNVPNSLGQLSKLNHLSLRNNSLNGTIPNFIGSLSLEVLDLSSNQFHGNVPNSLGQLSNLSYLDLSSNSLKGVISEVHFLNLTSLQTLDLSSNSLALDLRFHGGIPSFLGTIKLQSCKLGPTFPTWIQTQRSFIYLDISNAGISDSVPNWFWDLPPGLAFLNISSNEIKGKLPSLLPTLEFVGHPGMDLSNNHFEGGVPSFPSELAALNLSGNKFSGTLSFLCNFDGTLTLLDVSNNLLSGSLPDCWMKFQEKLVVLNLSNNNISGEIPSSLGTLSNLEALYLRKNAFVGEVPMSLRNCTRLRFVDLGENKLSGVVPEWIGEELSKLYVLVLGSNNLYGSLPYKLCWLYNLQVLDLSNNGLSGNIPTCFYNFTAMARRSFGDDIITSHAYSYNIFDCHFGDFCSADHVVVAQFLDNAWITWKGTKRSFGKTGLNLLKSIDLSRNNLSGKLPDAITGLFELVSLNLSVNKLHGEAPKDMGRLKSLESLDLSRNEFSGQIPWSLAQLNFLSYLDLSFNNLSGRIPTGSQLQGFNYTSYSGNPQLCGPPLTPRCGFPPVAEQKDVGEEDDDNFWKLNHIGVGAGFAFGFLGVCGALILNCRCRYIFFALLSDMKDWMYVVMAVHFRKLESKFRR